MAAGRAFALLLLTLLGSEACAPGAEGGGCTPFDGGIEAEEEAEEFKVQLLQLGLRRERSRQAPATGHQDPSQPEPLALENVLPGEALAKSRRVHWLRLPPCKNNFWLSNFARDSASWCDPAKVAPQRRAPKKLQGLYWLDGLPLPDVAACFSRGSWNQDELTLRLNVWSDFVFIDSFASELFESQIYAADMHYLVRFHDEGLSNATIHPEGKGLQSLSMKVFDIVSDFPLVEVPQQVAGEIWQRPSYFGLGNFKVKVNEYALRRILDGDLKVVTANTMAMREALDPRDSGLHLTRYSKDCLPSGACKLDTGGTCNALQCGSWRGNVDCVKQGFVWRCICQPGHCAVGGRCWPSNTSSTTATGPAAPLQLEWLPA